MKPHGFIAPAEPLVLVEELSHRVINQFTHAILSIEAIAGRIADCEAKAGLSDAVVILRGYAAAHRALQVPHAAGPTSLGDYLARICSALSSAGLREQGVRLTLKRGDAWLDAARCWRVGLVVAELINNAVRHGFRGGGGEITIDFGSDGGTVFCRVADDGCAEIEMPPARGRFLVEALTADLSGEVVWRFSPQGTTVHLTVPADSSRGREHRAAAESPATGLRLKAEII